MNSTRRPAFPSARATGLYARTIFRELKRAEYSKTELVSFINELIELVTTEVKVGPLTGITDPETQIPNSQAVTEALEFEMHRARERGSSVAVLVFDLRLPSWVPDDVAQGLHERVTRQLLRGLRSTDTVGRLSRSQYALIAPGCPPTALEGLARRMVDPMLAARRPSDRMPDGVTVRVSAGAYDGPTASARVADSAEPEPVESANALFARIVASGAREPGGSSRIEVMSLPLLPPRPP